MTAWIGTSGWHYEDWRGRFYPRDLAQRGWLLHYAERFETVELNNPFYRLPTREAFEAWRDAVHGRFLFSVKASRYLTHVKRLNEPEEPVGRLMERAIGLGPRLGPILLQLPPNLEADPAKLDRTLACFPAGVRVAVEARHPSWFSDETRSVLDARGAAWVLADGGVVQPPRWLTGGWCYVRFHRGGGDPPGCYNPGPLATWARRLAELCPGGDRDLFCYFNNDPHGCAVRDARRFAAALAKEGIETTGVPTAGETPVG